MTSISAAEQIARARKAQSAWGSLSLRDRTRALTRMRRQIAADRSSLVNAIVSDTGKPRLDALGGDVLVTLEFMRYYERHSARTLKARQVGHNPLFFAGCRFTEHFEPHGTVLVFGPANYPLQLCLIPAITALYAGNAVVLKVSEKTPAVAGLIQEMANKAALPLDLLQVTCVGPERAGELIDAAPDFVFFTGDSNRGKLVASRAAAHGIPTLLELGGSDAALVFQDCNFERTVEGITYGAFSNAGQVCVGIKRLLVQQSIYESFLDALVRRTSHLRFDEGEESEMGKLPCATAMRRFHTQVEDALSGGARPEIANCSIEGMPVILSNVSQDARILREGAFGPVLSIQPFASEHEAIELANTSPFALGASVWTSDYKKARRVAHALNAGNCAINDVIRSIANPHAAFGGNRASGYGRYHGPHGLHAFSRIKTVMENRTSRKPEINWFPLTSKKYDRLNSLIELLHRPSGLVTALRRVVHLAALAGLICTMALQAQTANLVLLVRLPHGAHGRVAYLLFDSPRGFPQDKAKALRHGFSVPVGDGAVETIDLGKLPPGRYAASVYLDENGNGKLDSGLFGIPREPVGVSNNPPRRMGPPRFEDCAFTISSRALSLSIDLVRP